MDQQQDWRRGMAARGGPDPAAAEEEESDGEESSLPEQCFYASFKIYLGPLEAAAAATNAGWSGQSEGKYNNIIPVIY